MRIALVQIPLLWEQPESNRTVIAAKLESIPGPVDLIILPEMFTTGFTMSPHATAEELSGSTVQWMLAQSKKLDAAICGSVIITEANNFYNRFLFVMPSGEIRHYDKRHLFTLAGEHHAYTAGKEKLIIEYKGWKICPMVCYDLRFPVFSRNVEDYDLLLYVANWPEPRVSAWDILLKARAIENMCYVAGVNRIGEDNNGLRYVGHSQAVDYFGNMLIDASGNDGVYITTLDREKMLDARRKLAFLNDRDSFTVN